MRQGGISSGISFNFYLNEVITDILKLMIGCTLNCSGVNILGCADDLVLLASPAELFHDLLKTLTCKLHTP